MNNMGYIAYIKGRMQDRGFMADMRKAGSSATRGYAWPHMAAFCDLRDPLQEATFSLVGYSLAKCKRDAVGFGNLGLTLRCLAVQDKQKPGGGGPVDGRVKRLLACRSVSDLCQQLRPVLGLVASKGGQLDHCKLLEDLSNWGEAVRRNWAAAYYT